MADQSFEFTPAPVATVAIAGSAKRFPINRIYCVGRNYAAHIREMGFDPAREPPFFFMKPADAIVENDTTIPYPPDTSNFHYEIELVIAIAKGGVNVPVETALDHVFGYGVGIDLTRRDRQIEARDKGRPWETGKAVDRSAPCSPLHRASEIGHPAKGRIWLSVNGETKQNSDLANMIWSVPETIAALSRSWELKAGDLIYSGTPDGIGAVKSGDSIVGGVDGLTDIRLKIA